MSGDSIREALDAMGEIVWAGEPRGEDASCVICTGYWPHHVEGCFAGVALSRLDALVGEAAAAQELREECEARGLPVSAKALARHERAAGEMTAGFDKIAAEREATAKDERIAELALTNARILRGAQGDFDWRQELEREVAAKDKQLLDTLVYLYEYAPVYVAAYCDQHLDRSGALLGRVRDQVAGVSPAQPAEEAHNPVQGDRRRVITTSECIMEFANYCRWPGGPGCKSATPEGPCCGEGDWYVAEHLLDRTTQTVVPLPRGASSGGETP